MLRPSDRWGPFDVGLTPEERDARLRVLRAVAGLVCGHRGRDVQNALLKAERALTAPVAGLAAMTAVEEALEAVVAALGRLPSRDYREVLASYGAHARMRSAPAPRQQASR